MLIFTKYLNLSIFRKVKNKFLNEEQGTGVYEEDCTRR